RISSTTSGMPPLRTLSSLVFFVHLHHATATDFWGLHSFGQGDRRSQWTGVVIASRDHASVRNAAATHPLLPRILCYTPS
ncbi:MAG: hypothetical protein M3Z24_00790, partial [Chloroflexota bacterium]|nr:hypothetical protein [Chloroflexota bacterium]